VSLPAFLAAWGLLSLSVVGEVTASTWALGLAAMFPVSALLVAATGERVRHRTRRQYALGLVGGVVVLSVAYLGVAAVDDAPLRGLVGLNTLEVSIVGAAFALFGTALALVDSRYVEHPLTAALLEDRYLDDPPGSE
jgi:hypothetical protein